jgi:hypothetical protein
VYSNGSFPPVTDAATLPSSRIYWSTAKCGVRLS